MKQFILRTEAERAMALDWLRRVNLGEPLELTARPYKSKRNNEQNRLMWAVLNEIAEATPWSAEAWHEHFKRSLIGAEEWPLPDGTTQLRGLSTTTLNVAEFSDYVTRIQAFAANELGIRLAA